MTVNLLITRTSFVTVPGTTTVTKTSSFIREVTDVTEPFDGKFYFVQILTSEFKFPLFFQTFWNPILRPLPQNWKMFQFPVLNQWNCYRPLNQSREIKTSFILILCQLAQVWLLEVKPMSIDIVTLPEMNCWFLNKQVNAFNKKIFKIHLSSFSS